MKFPGQPQKNFSGRFYVTHTHKCASKHNPPTQALDQPGHLFQFNQFSNLIFDTNKRSPKILFTEQCNILRFF